VMFSPSPPLLRHNEILESSPLRGGAQRADATGLRRGILCHRYFFLGPLRFAAGWTSRGSLPLRQICDLNKAPKPLSPVAVSPFFGEAVRSCQRLIADCLHLTNLIFYSDFPLETFVGSLCLCGLRFSTAFRLIRFQLGGPRLVRLFINFFPL